MKQEIIQRLSALRSHMAAAGIDAVIIPKTDPHQSEYLADHWQVIRWLTGFTGSYATVVVTASEALMWTDSRYFLQASEQLEGTTVVMMKEAIAGTPTIDEYLTTALGEGAIVGIDGMLFGINRTRQLADTLQAHKIGLEVDYDPIDELWEGRPALPSAPVFIHDIKYAGESAGSKIDRVLAETRLQGAQSTFICDLAEIAWALNIRCTDVAYNPVASGFLLIAPEGSTLFIDEAKITNEVRTYLADCNVGIAGYTDAKKALAGLDPKARVLLSSTQAAGVFLSILGDRAVIGTSPVAMLKAVKNDVQIAGFRQAMERDGVALVRSFREIERRMKQGVSTTELDVAAILRKYRSEQELYFEESFETIAGFGPHGAIVHYSATPESDATLTPDNLLLVDSGASYYDGTTDITRTVALGAPTEEQRRDFTLVLKGHVALSMAVYPEGTRGVQLDALARMPLWKEGLGYLHGTGHGVGHFLNVHEGPQTIRMNYTEAPLVPGMITSNEPGLYRTDKWGIRTENLVLTIPAMTTEFGTFYRFETLTLFPYDLSLIEPSMLNDDEIDWINNYHNEVFRRLSPMLTDDEREWLRTATSPISKA